MSVLAGLNDDPVELGGNALLRGLSRLRLLRLRIRCGLPRIDSRLRLDRLRRLRFRFVGAGWSCGHRCPPSWLTGRRLAAGAQGDSSARLAAVIAEGVPPAVNVRVPVAPAVARTSSAAIPDAVEVLFGTRVVMLPDHDGAVPFVA